MEFAAGVSDCDRPSDTAPARMDANGPSRQPGLQVLPSLALRGQGNSPGQI